MTARCCQAQTNQAYYSIAEEARPKRQVIEFLPNGSVREAFI